MRLLILFSVFHSKFETTRLKYEHDVLKVNDKVVANEHDMYVFSKSGKAAHREIFKRTTRYTIRREKYRIGIVRFDIN